MQVSGRTGHDGACVVRGGRLLRGGTVGTAGFKHSLVTVTAAAAAAAAAVRIGNCPDIVETRVLAELLDGVGGSAVHTGGSLLVDCSTLTGTALDPVATARIHGSVYLLPALVARRGRAVLPVAGGCRIGNGPGGGRPVEQYVDVLERFGARVDRRAGGTLDVAAGRLAGCDVDLLDYAADRRLRTGPLYSGATKMAVLAAAVAHGTSTLRAPYPKPDVTDLVAVLRGLGADIEELPGGDLVVRGRGPEALDRPVRHELLPDLIEVVTWICAGATLCQEPLRILGPGMDRAARALAPELAVLAAMGLEVRTGGGAVTVGPAGPLRPVHVTVASTGVYSDSQPFLALLATRARGRSTLTETVWANRFDYLPALAAMGADLRRCGNTLHVHGPRPVSRPAGRVRAGDLRAAAVLLLAGLAPAGTTVVEGTHHLERGYPDLPGALRELGADIAPLERR